MHDVYGAQTKKFPLWSPFFRGILPKICMICPFRWEHKILLRKWLIMHIWMKKKVDLKNNVCHVSQEDVCKSCVALYPGFTDACRKILIPEEGFNTIPISEILLNLIRKMKYVTDQFQLCFCFCIGNAKQLYFISALATQLASLRTTC